MRLLLATLLVAGAFACGSSSHTASIVVETASPAINGDRLIEPVGLETLGGVFTPLLAAQCKIPCEDTETFSTAEDNQREIALYLFRGTAPRVADNHPLGTFVIVGIPPAPRGEPQVRVTFRAADGQILVLAREESGAPIALERRD